MHGKFCLGAIALGLSLGTLAPTAHAGIVGYYTDFNVNDTGPQNIITETGQTAVHITTLTGFNLGSVNTLMIDESSNGAPSSDVTSSLAAIQSFVNAGGKLIIHDRGAGLNGSGSPFLLGNPGITVHRMLTTDVDVATPGTLVTNGPFGTINNSTLDGGNSSAHGYADVSTLPAGAVNILSMGGLPTESVAFSYALGQGFVYYSTIPLDYYLDNNSQPAFDAIYAPNMLSYVANLGSAAVPEPSTVVLLGVGLAGLGGFGRLRRKKIA